MVLFVAILVLSSITSLETWELLGQNDYTLLEGWGVSRVKRMDRIQEKFADKPDLTCDLMHKTKEVPFTAIVLFRSSGRLLCMGSIIDNSHILTAKRCYEKTEVGDLLVLVGYYKAYWGKYSQVKKVRKIVRHEYEMAILRLAEKIKFTEYVQPARLPSSITKTELKIETAFPPPYKVVGFFVDRYDVPGDYIDRESIYRVKEDKLVDFEVCKTNYTTITLEASKLFCTTGNGNATYCWGGWGAPVLKWMGNSYYLQVGVVILDNCTADTTGPFLVARTDSYGDWIRGNSYHGHQPS